MIPVPAAYIHFWISVGERSGLATNSNIGVRAASASKTAIRPRETLPFTASTGACRRTLGSSAAAAMSP